MFPNGSSQEDGMGVTFRVQRDGTIRQHWYGVYREAGTRRVVNLDVPIQGTPPGSLSLRDTGDEDFEESRKAAQKKLDEYMEDAGRKGRADHLTERLIESKTGRPVEYCRMDELAARWRGLGRETPASEAYLQGCDAAFNRFVEFMRVRNVESMFLYQVTPEDAGAFMAVLQSTLARKTVRDSAKLLNKAFERCLPVGVANPFSGFVGRRSAGESETVHRKPFTDKELEALLAAARDDAFMYPLIVTAACSGMRRGDVCCLPWSAVDLADGMLTVKTSKTGADVEIPIFKPLRAVLEARKGNGSELVFPEAASLLERNPDALTWQFKKIVARAFGVGDSPALPPTVPAVDVLAEGEAAIIEKVQEGPRRERMLKIFRAYCDGGSLVGIVKATGHAKCTVSLDLHTVQEWIGKSFMRVQTPSIKRAIRASTQVERVHGQRAASVRDWHALRATFVTLALSAGVPVELVRRVTGHATVEVVLKHYFRPDREQFKSAFKGAMPNVLTGGESTQSLAADELHALTGKIAAGTATEAERKRMRVLAAKV
jgi:integrase